MRIFCYNVLVIDPGKLKPKYLIIGKYEKTFNYDEVAYSIDFIAILNEH